MERRRIENSVMINCLKTQKTAEICRGQAIIKQRYVVNTSNLVADVTEPFHCQTWCCRLTYRDKSPWVWSGWAAMSNQAMLMQSGLSPTEPCQGSALAAASVSLEPGAREGCGAQAAYHHLDEPPYETGDKTNSWRALRTSMCIRERQRLSPGKSQRKG